MTHTYPKPQVNDLSLLSMLAAHELERLQRQEPSQGQYLLELRNQLAEQLSGGEANDIKSIAPSTIELYRKAVHDATANDPPDFASLQRELNGLLEQLVRAPQQGSDQNLQPLLAFVI